MRQPFVICNLLVLTLFAYARRVDSQTDAASIPGTASYGLNVSVDEVSLIFHAADAQGLPINDLKVDELRLLDNGKPPRKMLAFQLLRDSPIRAGILMDTSESMGEFLPGDRAISIKYAQSLLRQQTDQAFVMAFGRQSRVVQSWSSDASALIAGIGRVTADGSHIGGTALFDAVFRACFNLFGNVDHAASGNFILLFSDGDDNASHVSLKEAVDMCQRTHTAIYSFRADSKSSFGSPGPRTLAELASESGGRVFHDNGSEAGVYSDLRTIEAELRNQYRLVYKPAEMKRDGSFHRIELRAPERVDSIVIRSGYYAPAH
jgi:Ca-activated chloride channel family protein